MDLAACRRTPWGRRIARTLMGHGVDTSHIVWAEGERLGTFFVEFGDGARATSIIYDRADSAASRMTPDELPVELFNQAGGRHLHLTGITLAISATSAATAKRALELAQGGRLEREFRFQLPVQAVES